MKIFLSILTAGIIILLLATLIDYKKERNIRSKAFKQNIERDFKSWGLEKN
jgi:hypothetical protein